MSESNYEARARVVDFKQTDPRDLFTSSGRRVYWSDVERWRSSRRNHLGADLARRAALGEQRAIDEFEVFIAEAKEGAVGGVVGIVALLIGGAVLAVGAGAIGERVDRRAVRKSRERDFPSARVIK